MTPVCVHECANMWVGVMCTWVRQMHRKVDEGWGGGGGVNVLHFTIGVYQLPHSTPLYLIKVGVPSVLQKCASNCPCASYVHTTACTCMCVYVCVCVHACICVCV